MKSTLLSFLLFCCFYSISFAQKQAPEKVLFVGNSYTYFWNMPKLVHLMAKEKKIDLTTRQSTSGGVTLGMHWRGERSLKSKEKIDSKQFDAVVFQDHSMRAILYPDSLIYFGTQLIELSKKNNVHPYLYMTWAREWNPLMQEQITITYNQLAKATNATVVPVGPAWALARKLRPNLKLYHPDGSHPSTLGTYLTACMFFAILTGESPVGLPTRLVSMDENGDPLFLMTTNSNDATFCQQVVERVLKEWKDAKIKVLKTPK